jgi:hypothetical protein
MEAHLVSEKQLEISNEMAAEHNLFRIWPEIVNKIDYVAAHWFACALLMMIGLFKLDEVISVLLYGHSGSGKTEAARKVLNLIDHLKQLGSIVERIDISPEWLKYAGGDDDGSGLRNKVLFSDEINPCRSGQSDRRQELLLQLHTAEKEVTFAIVDRSTSGVLSERILRLQLPIYTLNTTITPPNQWDDQFQSRSFFFECALSPAQVEEAQRRVAQPTLDDEELSDLYLGLNHFFSTLLRQDKTNPDCLHDIDIPFLSELVKHNPDSTGMDIRAFKQLKLGIKASAILHQHHRTIEVRKGRKYLIATREDLANVSPVLRQVLAPKNSLSNRHIYVLRKIAPLLSSYPMHRNELASISKIPQRTLEESLPLLVKEGLLEIDESLRKGDRKLYYQVGYKIKLAAAKLTQSGTTQDQIRFAIDSILNELERQSNLWFGPQHDPDQAVAVSKATAGTDSEQLRNSAADKQATEQEAVTLTDFE